MRLGVSSWRKQGIQDASSSHWARTERAAPTASRTNRDDLEGAEVLFLDPFEALNALLTSQMASCGHADWQVSPRGAAARGPNHIAWARNTELVGAISVVAIADDIVLEIAAMMRSSGITGRVIENELCPAPLELNRNDQ